MKKVMGDVDDENLDIIFMKVDANCDGSVDWVRGKHELSSQIQLSKLFCVKKTLVCFLSNRLIQTLCTHTG